MDADYPGFAEQCYLWKQTLARSTARIHKKAQPKASRHVSPALGSRHPAPALLRGSLKQARRMPDDASITFYGADTPCPRIRLVGTLFHPRIVPGSFSRLPAGPLQRAR